MGAPHLGGAIVWLALVAALARAQPEPSPLPEPRGDERPQSKIRAEPTPDERDDVIEGRIRSIFRQVEELDEVQVTVESGVVHLTGTAASAESIARAGALAERLEGVVFVDNDVLQPEHVRDRLAPAVERLRQLWERLISYLPLLGVGVLVVVGFWALSAWVKRTDWLLAWLVRRPLLRGVVQQIAATAIFLLGIVLALEVLEATALVGAVLGAAGLVGLALSFAFRDIAENYLASILLGMRRPFGANDLVRIGEHEGIVVRLTMRETILMSLDGNHVRLPNALVFKSVVLNFSANPLRRFDVEIGVGAQEDLVRAQRVGTEALAATPGVVATPPATSWVDRLGESSIELRFFGWVDQRAFDWFKVRSEARRRLKVAFDEAGIDVPPPIHRVLFGDSADRNEPVRLRTDGEPTAPHDLAADSYLEDQIALDHTKSRDENLLEPSPRGPSAPDAPGD